MPNVEIVDRSSLISGFYKELVLDPERMAIAAIDMHCGHLDMEVATMPAKFEDAKRVIDYARAALDLASAHDSPLQTGRAAMSGSRRHDVPDSRLARTTGARPEEKNSTRSTLDCRCS